MRAGLAALLCNIQPARWVTHSPTPTHGESASKPKAATDPWDAPPSCLLQMIALRAANLTGFVPTEGPDGFRARETVGHSPLALLRRYCDLHRWLDRVAGAYVAPDDALGECSLEMAQGLRLGWAARQMSLPVEAAAALSETGAPGEGGESSDEEESSDGEVERVGGASEAKEEAQDTRQNRGPPAAGAKRARQLPKWQHADVLRPAEAALAEATMLAASYPPPLRLVLATHQLMRAFNILMEGGDVEEGAASGAGEVLALLDAADRLVSPLAGPPGLLVCSPKLLEVGGRGSISEVTQTETFVRVVTSPNPCDPRVLSRPLPLSPSPHIQTCPHLSPRCTCSLRLATCVPSALPRFLAPASPQPKTFPLWPLPLQTPCATAWLCLSGPLKPTATLLALPLPLWQSPPSPTLNSWRLARHRCHQRNTHRANRLVLT